MREVGEISLKHVCINTTQGRQRAESAFDELATAQRTLADGLSELQALRESALHQRSRQPSDAGDQAAREPAADAAAPVPGDAGARAGDEGLLDGGAEGVQGVGAGAAEGGEAPGESSQGHASLVNLDGVRGAQGGGAAGLEGEEGGEEVGGGEGENGLGVSADAEGVAVCGERAGGEDGEEGGGDSRAAGAEGAGGAGWGLSESGEEGDAGAQARRMQGGESRDTLSLSGSNDGSGRAAHEEPSRADCDTGRRGSGEFEGAQRECGGVGAGGRGGVGAKDRGGVAGDEARAARAGGTSESHLIPGAERSDSGTLRGGAAEGGGAAGQAAGADESSITLSLPVYDALCARLERLEVQFLAAQRDTLEAAHAVASVASVSRPSSTLSNARPSRSTIEPRSLSSLSQAQARGELRRDGDVTGSWSEAEEGSRGLEWGEEEDRDDEEEEDSDDDVVELMNPRYTPPPGGHPYTSPWEGRRPGAVEGAHGAPSEPAGMSASAVTSHEPGSGRAPFIHYVPGHFAAAGQAPGGAGDESGEAGVAGSQASTSVEAGGGGSLLKRRVTEVSDDVSMSQDADAGEVWGLGFRV